MQFFAVRIKLDLFFFLIVELLVSIESLWIAWCGLSVFLEKRGKAKSRKVLLVFQSFDSFPSLSFIKITL